MSSSDSLEERFVVLNSAVNWAVAKTAGNKLKVERLEAVVEEQGKRLAELEERCLSLYKFLHRKGLL